MISATRYLTKSRFKTALECPIKLYYTGKKEYPDNKIQDSFLQSLAEGGFQVGEMAKLYYAGGVDIKEKSNALAEAQTKPLLQQDQVTIYEAAIRYQNFFIRTDILIKKENTLNLIEVKAKSIRPSNHSFYLKKRDGLDGEWESYIADAAFQKHVLQLVYPDLKVNTCLMLVNKEAKAPTDGLNQLFKIVSNGGNAHAEFTGDMDALPDFGDILLPIPVDAEIDYYINTYSHPDFGDFQTAVKAFADAYANDTPLYPKNPLSKDCKDCEFQPADEKITPLARSGYRECWQKFANFKEADFTRARVLDIWKFPDKKAFLAKGTYFQDALKKTDIIKKVPPADASAGLSPQERQWLQVTKSTQLDRTPYLDKENLKPLMQSWEYPLHFIDFETATVAIPFHKGRRPYEQVAFQFSHHAIDESGRLHHAHEFIAADPGEFPNFEFVRALRSAIGNDQGTVFRYATHENTVLNQIREQLLDSEESDRHDLCDFIESITYRGAKEKQRVFGERNMVDLRELVIKYYYHQAMAGSNSLKAVLPATLGASAWLQERYGQSIYGTQEIPSHNFSEWQWVRYDTGNAIIDPYKLLPAVVDGIDNEQLEDWLTNGNEKIANGGAALTAYSRMQFEQMPSEERERLRVALLKYCELDTLAMVMLYEAWKDWLKL